MFSKITLAVLATSLLTSASFAREIHYKEGFIGAQTEILGDSNIAPKCHHITTKLTMDETLETLKGEISMELINLRSENEKRDINMHETLHVKEHPITTFTLKEVKKEADGYHLVGVLSLNKQIKAIDTKADITEQENLLKLKGGFSIKMTDFGIEPPTLLFLSVRDEVAISYDLALTKK